MTDIPVPADGGQGGAAPQPATAAIPWLGEAPEDIVAFVQNKGWDSPVKAIDSYRNLERLRGVPENELLRIPNWEKADKTELDQFFNRLGRPQAPDAYELKLPENADQDFVNWAKSTFHEAGLNPRQAQTLLEKYNEFSGSKVESMTQAEEAARLEANQQEVASLQKEWGKAYDQQVAMAREAAKVTGVTQEQIEAIEKAMGYSGTMKFFAGLGSRLGEDKFVGAGERNGNFGAMTPAQAQEQIKTGRGEVHGGAEGADQDAQVRSRLASQVPGRQRGCSQSMAPAPPVGVPGVSHGGYGPGTGVHEVGRHRQQPHARRSCGGCCGFDDTVLQSHQGFVRTAETRPRTPAQDR